MAPRTRSDAGPFSIVPAWVLDSDLSDGAVRLYAVLLRYADGDDQAWPSRTTLAARLRCSVDTIDRRIGELRTLGALTTEARYDGEGGRRSNVHTVRLARPPLRTDAAPPPRTDAEEKENQLERETDTAAKRPRPRDPLFDALVSAFGPASTPSRARFYGKTVAELRAVNATAEQVARAVRAMNARGWERPTPAAMVKHWDDLLRAPVLSEPRNPAASRWWETGS